MARALALPSRISDNRRISLDTFFMTAAVVRGFGEVPALLTRSSIAREPLAFGIHGPLTP